MWFFAGGHVQLKYANPESRQTLRDALDEYYAANPELLAPDTLPADAEAMFRRHDAGHVVFGCDTSLRGETLIDTWTIFATSAGLRGYLEYFKYPQVNKIFADVGYLRIAWESIVMIPEVCRVMVRSRRLSARWPWEEWESHLDQGLDEIRANFNIQIVV